MLSTPMITYRNLPIIGYIFLTIMSKKKFSRIWSFLHNYFTISLEKKRQNDYIVKYFIIYRQV